MTGAIRIEYAIDKAKATFTCPFCEQVQTRDFHAQIVRGRLDPDPMSLVRHHLNGNNSCPDYKGANDSDRDIEDYRIVVHMDGLKISQTPRPAKKG